MEYIGNLFNDAMYNLISVFSDPVVLLPVCICIFVSAIAWVFHKLVGG